MRATLYGIWCLCFVSNALFDFDVFSIFVSLCWRPKNYVTAEKQIVRTNCKESNPLVDSCAKSLLLLRCFCCCGTFAGRSQFTFCCCCCCSLSLLITRFACAFFEATFYLIFVVFFCLDSSCILFFTETRSSMRYCVHDRV